MSAVALYFTHFNIAKIQNDRHEQHIMLFHKNYSFIAAIYDWTGQHRRGFPGIFFFNRSLHFFTLQKNKF
jgi:hypothetical protein